jgi:hypothetical protein
MGPCLFCCVWQMLVPELVILKQCPTCVYVLVVIMMKERPVETVKYQNQTKQFNKIQQHFHITKIMLIIINKITVVLSTPLLVCIYVWVVRHLVQPSPVASSYQPRQTEGHRRSSRQSRSGSSPSDREAIRVLGNGAPVHHITRLRTTQLEGAPSMFRFPYWKT